ncbi:3-isopropylmalate dehydratase small subunit [Baekduia soli]|uniref:3-isopropylmalate dehydratase small subunit n=1 Tax=Baekduia soli TaxID=496014 RepID=A0A5B8U641_9ACTN|nr:3-isopropylmalate dehydratase small subunit [Baekduia soli]QEC48401.1 3-isopropylmalate dehydratase small subunit [Baekduia soli]
MSDVITGRAVVLGDDVNTDNIIPGPYLNITDPEELGRHLLETYDAAVGAAVAPGDILVGGRNFGMGSSREQAQVAIMARGVQAIVAGSFARIFLRNCINVGLAVAESPEAVAAIADGDELRIDFTAGTITRGDDTWTIPPRPPFVGEILEAGGLVGWAQERLRRTSSTQGRR